MSNIRNCLTALAAGLLTLLLPIVAHAATFGFTNNITNNGNPYVGGQLSVEVAGVDANHVSFTFSNVGLTASSITDIYFVNSPALFDSSGAPSVENHPGVNFTAFVGDSGPGGGLPGGTPFGFGASSLAFQADANSPNVPQSGINPGESLAIVFALLGGESLGSVIDAVFGNTLRIGLHVQSIANRGSDSYLLTATPLPGALPLFVTGLVSLGLLRRRQRKGRTA